MNTTTHHITLDTMIPDLLKAAPQARAVLDRHGLHGCGGPEGPMESLKFFARAHDVPADQLLAEIKSAVAKGTGQSADNDASAAARPEDTIYMPFFKAGIAIVLTMGAVWGAWLLLRIGFSGSFTSVGLHEVNAHGHAQIFGWVGLFVMGFAYQAFPRFRHTRLAWPRLAMATLAMMVAGILLRSVCEPLVPSHRAWMFPALAGGALEIAAIGMFVAIIWRTMRSTARPLAVYEYFVLSAAGWFFIQAVYETAYFAATAMAPTRDTLLALVATWQAPLRDVQIHGFAMIMILGVSQRLFHHIFGWGKPSARRAAWALAALNLGVAGEVAGLVLMRTQGYRWAALWYLAVLLILGAVVALVADWKLWRRPAEPDRSIKFLRAAYVWLMVSLVMLALLPLYQFGLLRALAPESEAARIGFSHAFYGATRHAITVGFISLMIVGVAAKIVPTLKGVNIAALGGLWAPFLLINAGCALRVGGQTLTDFSPVAFPFAGVSGLLEVTGLAIWGVHLWGLMRRGQEAGAPASGESPAPDEPLAGRHNVYAVVSARPELLDKFIAYGFTPLANPLLRRTLARRITISQACRMMGVDESAFLGVLNDRSYSAH